MLKKALEILAKELPVNLEDMTVFSESLMNVPLAINGAKVFVTVDAEEYEFNSPEELARAIKAKLLDEDWWWDREMSSIYDRSFSEIGERFTAISELLEEYR